MKIRITYYGVSGITYSEVREYKGKEEDVVSIGKWDSPYPNNFAATIEADIIGSDRCPLLLRKNGIISISVVRIQQYNNRG